MVTALWIVLTVLVIMVAILLWRDYQKHKSSLENNSWLKTGLIGLVANFFDTLGIGSFAIETALLKFFRQAEDRLIPGTLNVANAIPTMLQGIIFVQIVNVEPITLIGMLAAAGAGAVIGAGFVARLSERKIRLIIGTALLITCGFMIASKLNWIQGDGDAIGLHGYKLVLGIAVNFILGSLMTAGIGLYAPCMALVFALGMSPAVAFPIMAGSCAVLMPLAAWRFIKEGAYNRKASFAISMLGVVGVLIAAFVVKSLPLDILRWLVMAVVIYTAAIMLKAGWKASVEKVNS